MKKLTKLLCLALAAALVLLTFSACSAKETGLEKIKKAGKIIMLTESTFAPYEYKGDAGKVVGADVDIANEIAKDLGVTLEIRDMDFKAIVDDIEIGRGDFGAAGMTITEERRKQVAFSVEYTTSTQYIIVPKAADAASFDLEGKTIGVQAGTTGDLFYATVGEDNAIGLKQSTVKRYPNAVDAVDNMLLGRVDCVIIDKLPAENIVASRPDKIICIDKGYEPEKYAFAIAKDNPELLAEINKTLNRLVSEGKVEQYILNHSKAK